MTGDRSTEYAGTLKAARKLIEKPENWCQGRFSDRGAWCAMGALSEVVMGAKHPSIISYSDAVNALEVEIGGGVLSWNDDPGQTHAEVLAVFDRAIAKAETGG